MLSVYGLLEVWVGFFFPVILNQTNQSSAPGPRDKTTELFCYGFEGAD